MLIAASVLFRVPMAIVAWEEVTALSARLLVAGTGFEPKIFRIRSASYKETSVIFFISVVYEFVEDCTSVR